MNYELLEFAYGLPGTLEKSPSLQFAEWQSKVKTNFEIVQMSSSISSIGDQILESLFIMIKYV